MTTLDYRAKTGDAGKLLGDLLREDLQISRSLLSRLKLLPQGIQVNGEEVTVRKVLEAGDFVSLAIDRVTSASAICLEAGPLDLVYEDRHCLVVNKAPGITMYPRYQGELGSLAGRVLHHLSQSQTAPVFHPIGRLDKDSSGLVLLAKNPYAAGFLQGRVHGKYYLAQSYGKIKTAGSVRLPIAKKAHGQAGVGIMELSSKGRPARSDYWPLAWDRERASTLVLVQIHSGRRHQIRVHLSHLGHPLWGDRAYGGPGDGGQELTCIALSFELPGGRPLQIRYLSPQDRRFRDLPREAIFHRIDAIERKGGPHVDPNPLIL